MTKAIQIRQMSLGSGIPKICVPLTGKTQSDLIKEAGMVKEAAPDLVEWRADAYVDLLNIEKTLGTLDKIAGILGEIPVLFTIRTSHEGGMVDIRLEDYCRVNQAVAESGKAPLVDVEVFWDEEQKKSLIKDIQKNGVVVIASSHDFQKTDSETELRERFLNMDQTGADILKMAVMPQSFQDVLAILKVTNEMVNGLTEKPVISMSMGPLGAVSRICGERAGSALTFGTVGAASAPGQIPIQTLREMLQVLHWGRC